MTQCASSERSEGLCFDFFFFGDMPHLATAERGGTSLWIQTLPVPLEVCPSFKVDNRKGEVIKNRPDVEPELVTNAVAKARSA